MTGVAITNDAGLTLQLTPGQNLLTEQASAWMADTELPGEFSYSIDAPLNENNKKFVQYAYRPDAALPEFSIPVTVQMEGVLYRRCTFEFEVQQGKLRGHLELDSSEFYEKIRSLSLLEALPDLINLGNGIRTINGVTTITSLGGRMKEIAAMAPGEFPCTFFPIRNQAFWEDEFDSSILPGFVRNEYVNAWELVQGVGLTFLYDTSAVKGSVIVPFFFLSWVLTRIMELAGYRIESDWLAQEEVQRLVVFNMTAMSQITPIYGGMYTALSGNRVMAGMHLPDMTVSDFLKAIKRRFALGINFNSNDRICYITQFADAIAREPDIDLTPYQSGDWSAASSSRKGFSVVEFIDENDDLYKVFEDEDDNQGAIIQPEPYLVGKGGQTSELKVGTTQLSLETNKLITAAAGKWFVPTVSQAGNVLDPVYAQSERYLDDTGKRRNKTGLKLLSYRGMTQDSRFLPYPLGTPDVRDGRQNVVGTQALTIDGRKGAWRNYLRQYFHFLDNTQLITQPLLLPVGVLSQLKLFRTVTLTLEDQVSRAYLIHRIRAESPGIDGKVRASLEALTIPTGLDLPADVDDQLVWISISVAEVASQGPVIPPGPWRLYDQKAATLTFSFWSNAAKTTPAVVQNLPVNLRTKKTLYPDGEYQPGAPYVENVSTYLLNGQSQVVTGFFTKLKRYKTRPGQNPLLLDDYIATYALDPGDGYNIIV